jgi:hypothetical protein
MYIGFTFSIGMPNKNEKILDIIKMRLLKEKCFIFLVEHNGRSYL